MNMMARILVGMIVLAMSVSCASTRNKGVGSQDDFGGGLGPLDGAGYGNQLDDMSGVKSDRMISWRGNLTIEVENVSNAVVQVLALTTNLGGYVSDKGSSGEKSASLTLRIPAQAFASSMESLGKFGKVTARNTWSSDVTEDYIDTEARLRNKKVLRDRLQQLLDKATEVKDILAIETELNRVQSDIESMEGRIRALREQVDFATIDVKINKKPQEKILGPLGWVGWFVKKLIVIRE